MNPQDLVMGVIILATITACISVLTVVRSWARKRAVPTPVAAYDAEAIARLQASVDAISIEVERISEAQRFTTRLLNERVIEPHKLPADRIDSLIGQ